MAKSTSTGKHKSKIIDAVGITSDNLTSRGGLSLFVRYLRSLELLPFLECYFSNLRKSAKGRPLAEIFKQVICYFLDGTSNHLTYFDHLAKDEGYAAGIESGRKDMLSSHAVKRFFKSFSFPMVMVFRRLLGELFIWRLRLASPEVVVLGLDTMVMDNSHAAVREGVQFNYKKVPGFQPLQLTWGRYIIDASFRGGKKAGNHGKMASKMVRRAVELIRERYRADVLIIINVDGGFFDRKLLAEFEALKIGYTCSGMLFKVIRRYIDSVDRSCWGRYENNRQAWEYLEFGDKPGSWAKFHRVIYTRSLHEGDQQIFNFKSIERIIYTNLGQANEVSEQALASGHGHLLEAGGIIGLAHGRGADELVHRGLKDFGHEELPFKRFVPNTMYYYLMVLSFFLFESFKEDVCSEVVPVGSYATRVRRTVIDIAGKIIRTGGRVVLKVSRAVYDAIDLEVLWLKAGQAGPLSF